MKKILFLTLFLTNAAIAVPVHSWNDSTPNAPTPEEKSLIDPYVSLRAGFSQMSLTAQGIRGQSNGASAAVALGFRFKLMDDIDIRAEGEFTYGFYSNRDRTVENCFVPVSPGAGAGDLVPCDVQHDLTETQRAFMANIYIDFLTNSKIRPYVGFGLGSMDINAEMTVSGLGDYMIFPPGGGGQITGFDIQLRTNFTYGLYAGIGFNLTDSGSVIGDLGIRYLATSINNNASLSTTSYNLGIRIPF